MNKCLNDDVEPLRPRIGIGGAPRYGNQNEKKKVMKKFRNRGAIGT